MNKRISKTEELDELVTELAAQCKLDNWNQFIEEIRLPADLIPALMTGRSELLAIAQPRALTVEETAVLYKAIGALIETNVALRQHAEQLSILVRNWTSAFAGLRSIGDKIHRFANFERSDAEVDDESGIGGA